MKRVTPSVSCCGSAARFVSLAAALWCLAGKAEVPEPDTVLYGSIALDQQPITSERTDIVVELRASHDGPVLNQYQMGTDPAAGNFYLLRIKSESVGSVRESDAVSLGSTVYLQVRDSEGLRDQTTHTLTTRGKILRLDFGDVDTDGDGMSDRFETTYFGNATTGNPNLDSDNDGRPNLREFLQGTDPTVADGRHPADLAPADDALTIGEVGTYTLAWQVGEAWSIEPTNVPIAYVTRANLLWQGGEAYIFDNTPPTNAPNWWVNAPPAPAALAKAESQPTSSTLSKASTEQPADEDPYAIRDLPEIHAGSSAIQVINSVAPGARNHVYAVEDAIPEGWLVDEINHQGRFDRVNRKVKWGPFFDAAPRDFSYRVTPTRLAGATAVFNGTASFDGYDLTIAGQSTTTLVNPDQVRLMIEQTPEFSPRLSIFGAAEQDYVIEVSADLLEWSALTTIRCNSTGVAQWTEEGMDAVRFYRVRPASAAGE